MDGAPISRGLTTITIRIDGSDLPGTFRVVTIDVERRLDRITSARVMLQDGDASAQTFAASEDDMTAPGARIEIDVGYDRTETLVFDGVITRQRIEARRSGDTFLHLEAKDPAFRTTLSRQSRTFTDVSEADALTEALEAEGVTVEMDTGANVPQIVQYQATGWDFMRRRLVSLGLAVDCAGGKLRVFKPDPSQSPVQTLTYGSDIHRMDLELDAEATLVAVDAGAWSPGDQELLQSEVDSAPSPTDIGTPDLADVAGTKRVLRQAGARDQAALDALAQAHLERARQSSIRGVIEVQGTAEIKPGDVVELKGMGKRINANVLVRGIRHEIGRGDWMTSIEVGMEAERASCGAANAPIPLVTGLRIGTASALEGDPLGEDRIEVRLTDVTETDGLVWARIATLEAGDDRGSVFRPEIGDELILGFLGDDPRDPVILGALHSSAHPSPISAEDTNNVKGYVSRAGSKLQFDDDAPSVTIETEGGGKVVIDDGAGTITIEDQNGNTLEMASAAITLDGAKDIKLKAAKDIKLEATNITIDASATAALKSGAGTSVESSATTTVKGALVQIN